MDFKPHFGKIVEPGEMSINQAINYKGKDWEKLALTAKNYKRAGPFIGAGILATVLAYPVWNWLATKDLYGCDGKGGKEIKIETQNTADDIEYSREFQKFKYLVEPLTKNMERPVDAEQWLKLKGQQVPELHAQVVHKKAPHFKYF